MSKAEDCCIILASVDTLAELEEVLHRPKFSKFLSIESRIGFLKRYRQAPRRVPIPAPIRACRDQRDDRFLEVAVHGIAGMIVTGDEDLLPLDGFRGLRILTPRAFLELSAEVP